MNPSDEERQRRREDQQDPGRREQRAPLEIEVDGQRIGEGNGEGGQRQGEENAGDESTRTRSRQFDGCRSSDAERGYDQENRKGREREEIESAQESNGGAECETEEDLR